MQRQEHQAIDIASLAKLPGCFTCTALAPKLVGPSCSMAWQSVAPFWPSSVQTHLPAGQVPAPTINVPQIHGAVTGFGHQAAPRQEAQAVNDIPMRYASRQLEDLCSQPLHIRKSMGQYAKQVKAIPRSPAANSQ